MSEEGSLTKRDAALRERRLQILNAAIDCLVKKGFHNTGMRDIAKRAEVSLGNLYNHFPGKHDMLVGIAELEAEELSRFVEVLSGEEPALTTFSRFVEEYSAYTSNRDAAILNLEITAEAMRQQDVAKFFLQARASLTDALVALLRRGAIDGVFRASAASEETACFVLDLLESSAIRTLIVNPESKSEYRELGMFLIKALQR